MSKVHKISIQDQLRASEKLLARGKLPSRKKREHKLVVREPKR